jgi:hypothetical protein
MPAATRSRFSGGRHGPRPLPVCRATRRRHSVGTVSSSPIAILCSCAAWQACGEAECIAAIRALSPSLRCSTCLCIRHRRGESVLHGRQRRPSQGRRAAVASTVVAVGHVRAAAGAARGPQCSEIPHARQARRAGDRTNGPRKADHGIGVNRSFKSGSWEAAPHFRKNHQGPPASYLPEALDPEPDCACQYRPYASAVPATAEQVMA